MVSFTSNPVGGEGTEVVEVEIRENKQKCIDYEKSRLEGEKWGHMKLREE